ncbi:MAG: HNH endonuclease [Gammaproteobacteria bacterium]|nr:HNH endonuclease [Gammaproteobacteria bacterium]NNJ84188.1 HNH endonuclease [Gammaproteobacteria bacterium]
MVYLEKSQPAPACLAEEKTKANGNYKCGEVLDRLKDDFKNKCYICEDEGPISIDVEHFVPHKGDKDLKFDWSNLFLACTHCNRTKGVAYKDVLNCTHKNDNVDQNIRYLVDPFPSFKVDIRSLIEDARTETTKNLLRAVYNGETPTQKLESGNLRKKLQAEIKSFQSLLDRYNRADDEEKRYLAGKLKEHLDNASSFTAFKRWIIRDSAALAETFQDCLEQSQ